MVPDDAIFYSRTRPSAAQRELIETLSELISLDESGPSREAQRRELDREFTRLGYVPGEYLLNAEEFLSPGTYRALMKRTNKAERTGK